METFSALLASCAGNSSVTGEFPTERPVTRSFDVFFDLHLNKRLSKQLWGWWFETPSCPLWRHCNELRSSESKQNLQWSICIYIYTYTYIYICVFVTRRHMHSIIYYKNIFCCIGINRIWSTAYSTNRQFPWNTTVNLNLITVCGRSWVLHSESTKQLNIKKYPHSIKATQYIIWNLRIYRNRHPNGQADMHIPVHSQLCGVIYEVWTSRWSCARLVVLVQPRLTHWQSSQIWTPLVLVQNMNGTGSLLYRQMWNHPSVISMHCAYTKFVMFS